MTVVVDASVAVRWCFPLDRSDRADNVLRSGERLVAPDLILAELTNAAWKIVTFGGGAADVTLAMIRAVERTFDELVPSAALKDLALEMAIELRHPAYDCFYLALAQVRGIQLVTADDRLLRHCAGTRMSVLVRPL
jgi:predicted nucleic acid-binding protein